MLEVAVVGVLLFVVAILLFGATVFVHELGHFLAARACGMVVDVFSIGFGHAIWQRRIDGVLFKIGWIPLGGYVALPQMEPATEDRREADAASRDAAAKGEAYTPTVDDLPPIEPWKKIVVAVSGAIGNMIFAVVLAWVIYLSPSAVTGEGGTRIGSVDATSAAHAAGVRVGDEIVAVNGRAVRSWYEFRVEALLVAGEEQELDLTLRAPDGERRDIRVPTASDELGGQIVEGLSEAMNCVITALQPDSPAARAGLAVGDEVLTVDGERISGTRHFIERVGPAAGRSLAIRVERAGEPMEFAVTPEFDARHGRALVGANIASTTERIPPWMFYKNPWLQVRNDATAIFRVLRALVTPKESSAAAKGMGGPVSILTMLWLAVQMGLLTAVGFIRFLNVNLAVLNLLPIPILDGGHVMFALYEMLSRRRMNARVAHGLVKVFFVLLIALFITLTLRDVRLLRHTLSGGNDKPAVAAPAEPPPAPAD